MTRSRSTAVTALLLIALAAPTLLPSCLPGGRGDEASIVDAEQPYPGYAASRRRVLQDRMVPPRRFEVAPAPPRNNDFGEFDDALYAGLDAQPALPALPGGDIMPMMGGGAPASLPYADFDAPEAAGFAAQASAGGARGPAGTLHPIEQLVYGGDYPDVDKPHLYRLMPKDVISVTVKDHPEFSGKLEIQADGTVRVPNCPDLVRLRGLTSDEAAEELRAYLQLFIKGEAVVAVQTNRARGGYYFVFGDVTQPGRFPMGAEPIRLSDAVLAANWEVNPSRMDPDEELGPAFPAASPRGTFHTRRSADLARVMLITPHRSQPVRTVHDIRSAMLGVTREDPLVRPGQIVVVPSLDPERNLSLGLDVPDAAVPPDGLMQGRGFSGSDAPARLPEVNPASHPLRRRTVVPVPQVEENMASAFSTQLNTEAIAPREDAPAAMDYAPVETVREVTGRYGRRTVKTVRADEPDVCEDRPLQGWKKGF